jgi:hypothetical protein
LEQNKEASAHGVHVYPLDLNEIGVDPSDQDAFIIATEKAAKAMHKGAEAVLVNIDLDDAQGIVEATLKEVAKLTAEEKDAVRKSATARRENISKEAQLGGGAMGGGMDGGAGGAPGAGATMPSPDGAAAPATPPVESFSDQPGEEDGGSDDAEAKPPGSICPVCGSQDVDIVGGKGRCNNEQCGAEFVYKIQVDVTKWPGVTDTNSDDGDMNEDVGDASTDGTGESSGEGFEMPQGGAGGDASIPVAAMTRITPGMLEKLSATNKNYRLGSVSPLTGSTNTYALGNNEWLCMDTGRTYSVDLAVDSKNVKNVFAEFRWTPRLPVDDCSSCRRAKASWNKALKTAGLSDAQFEELSFLKKAETVLAMNSKGLFNVVKTASKNVSVSDEIKLAYATPKFPLQECRAKVSKMYGENAIALSGPNRGKNLADCVCNQLKSASVYSDKMALRVADAWSDKNSCVQCIEDYVRVGLDIEKATTACQLMKLKYAGSFELLAEDMAANPFGAKKHPMDDSDDSMLQDNGPTDDMGGDEIGGDLDADPFDDASADPMGGGDDVSIDVGTDGVDIGAPDDSALPDGGAVEIGAPDAGGEDHGTVTIKLPLSVLDAIEDAIDSAHGGASDHPELPDGMGDKQVDVEIPGGIADEVEDAVGPVLDDEIGSPSDDSESDGPSDDDSDGDDSSDDDSSDGMGFGDDDGDDSQPPFGHKKEGDDMKEEDHLAAFMHKGKISQYGEINLDVDAIAKAIGMKTAKTPTLEKAQDVVDGYSAGDGSTQGSEEKFKADKPKVPRDKAEMGPDEENPQDKPLPDVFTGDAEMGEEKELGYTSDGASMSGGTQGAGKTETAKNKYTPSINSGKQVTVPTKKADKLEKAKPVSETDGLNVPRSYKDHANTPPSMKRETFKDSEYPEIPEKGEGARIKGEVDMGSVPKADSAEYTPDIPVGGPALRGEEKSKKEFAPEKELAHKGTVAANSSEKSRREVEATAVTLAGRMVESKIINPSQLLEKIAELKQYQMPTLKQIEKTLFAKRTQKGLATEPDGVEQPVIISQSSNERTPADRDGEFQEQLQGLFTLHQRNKLAAADNVPIAELRKAYNHR